MYRQRRIVFTPSCPRAARAFGGKRVVSPRATNSSSQQPPALEEVLEAGNVFGTAAFEVLTEEAVEVAAEVSRVQAEQLRILSRLPEDPQGTLNDLVQDIQSRGVPSVSDLMNRATNVMVCSASQSALTASPGNHREDHGCTQRVHD